MKFYALGDAPLRLFGSTTFPVTGKPNRLPDDVIDQLPPIYRESLGKRCPGGRIGFRTDSKTLTVRFRLAAVHDDRGMSLYSCIGAHVLAGPRQSPSFVGLAKPASYSETTAEKTFPLDGVMRDYLIYLPRNEEVAEFTVGIDDGAAIEPPTPYDGKPIVYYGSSITEGGCACNPFNAYNARISNRLNMDYYNFGFSGSAKGELPVADYLAGLDMSVFVYDYDHNAPTAEHLQKTHEPFFRHIREKNPDLPILMMSRPAEKYGEDEKARREIILATYRNALAAGDRHVYFLDGETFYGENDRYECSSDGIHPNDLGFYRMSLVVEAKIREILGC